MLPWYDGMRRHNEENHKVNIQTVHRIRQNRDYRPAEKFGLKQAKIVNQFHRSFPEYSVTPLAKLSNLARHLGVSDIFVKDESDRFSLNAFKVLGGSYSIGSYIAERLGTEIEKLSYGDMMSDAVREKIGQCTFVTATDGNHGRGVAWTANRLRQRCIVYMPRGSAQERLNNIRALGAEASITDFNYDDTVRLADQTAKEVGGFLVQDTAWEGYEKIPTWIMQGYTTMALEAVNQLKGKKPTHVFLQAGVGAMAGAITGFMADYYKEDCPVITIVEPDHADCIFRTAKANDGEIHAVTGDLQTIMAGLACGEPCTIGWDMLDRYASHFISMEDRIAAKGMRVLGNPMKTDPRVISGESGAATMGFVAEVLGNPELRNLKESLGLDESSVILCFSTEGDTDRDNYRRIVWDGAYAN